MRLQRTVKEQNYSSAAFFLAWHVLKYRLRGDTKGVQAFVSIADDVLVKQPRLMTPGRGYPGTRLLRFLRGDFRDYRQLGASGGDAASAVIGWQCANEYTTFRGFVQSGRRWSSS